MGLAQVVANREARARASDSLKASGPVLSVRPMIVMRRTWSRVAHGPVQLGTRGGAQLCAAQAELHDDRARVSILVQGACAKGRGRRIRPGDCVCAVDRLAGRFRREGLGCAGGACRGHALREPGPAAEVELGQLRRRRRVHSRVRARPAPTCGTGCTTHARAVQLATRPSAATRRRKLAVMARPSPTSGRESSSPSIPSVCPTARCVARVTGGTPARRIGRGPRCSPCP
jgi:hypothetical protein